MWAFRRYWNLLIPDSFHCILGDSGIARNNDQTLDLRLSNENNAPPKSPSLRTP